MWFGDFISLANTIIEANKESDKMTLKDFEQLKKKLKQN